MGFRSNRFQTGLEFGAHWAPGLRVASAKTSGNAPEKRGAIHSISPFLYCRLEEKYEMYMSPNGKALISYRRVLAVDRITRVVQPLDV